MKNDHPNPLEIACKKIAAYPVHSETVGGAYAMQEIAAEALRENMGQEQWILRRMNALADRLEVMAKQKPCPLDNPFGPTANAERSTALRVAAYRIRHEMRCHSENADAWPWQCPKCKNRFRDPEALGIPYACPECGPATTLEQRRVKPENDKHQTLKEN